MYKFSIPHREKHTGNDNTCWYTGTKLNKRKSFSVHDSDGYEQQVVWREKLLVKRWEGMMCVWSKMVFLTPPCQGANPQILKLEFPMQTWGPKQKRK
jgi:hypothetical protein